MKREDDEQLWDLLGKARTPELSPFFARNVVRAARAQRQRGNFLAQWFNLRRLIPLSGVALAVIVAGLFVRTPSPAPKPAKDDPIVAHVDSQDYEVVADLDELLASDENNLWTDNSSL